MKTNQINRRQLLKWAGIAGSGALLAACTPPAAPTAPSTTSSGNKPVEPTAAPQTASSSGVEIEWLNAWSSKNTVEPLKAMIPVFEKETGIKVNFKNPGGAPEGGNYREILLSRIAGGDAPDVGYADTTPAEWAAQGAVIPIDDQMKAAKIAKPEAYYPAALKSCQWSGKTYGLPSSAGAGSMFINTKLLADKKISTKREDMPKTWDDWKALSAQFVEKDDKGGYKQIGSAPFVGNSWLYPVWSASFGGKIYDPASNTYTIDSKENQNWLGYWVTWLDEQYGGNLEALRTSGNWEGTYPNSGFNLGRSAISVEGSWATTDADIPFGFEVARFPVGPGATKSYTGFWPNWFMLPKGAKHPAEAFKFIEYLTTTGWVTWYKAIMDMPAWKDFPKDVLTEKLIKNVGKEKGLDYHTFFGDYLSDAVDMWNSPIEQFARDTMGSAVEEILSKKKTVQDGLAAAQKTCTEKLAQTVKS